MEDDEEILSHTSHDSEEPQQQVLEEDGEQEEEDEEEGRGIEIEIPNSNSNSNLNQSPPSGRITVTVAAAPPPSASSSLALVPMASPASATPTTMTANTPSTPPVPLAIALPIQNPAARPGGAVGGSGGGREDCWSEGATSVLIDAWGERYMELSRGNLKQKHWKEVADIVNNKADYGKTPKTDIQCKNRIDTVKKKYKTEKTKVSTGCGPSRWPFYERLERLIGPTANSAVKTLGGAVPTASVSTGINNNQKAVPVGIPVGIRQPLSLPFPPYSSPHLHPPPHLQSPPQQQQQPIRHFPTPISQQQRFSVNLNNNNNNVGRHQQLLHQQHKQQQYLHLQQQQQQQQQQQFRRGPMMAHPPPVDSDSEQEGWSNDSEDSLPPSIGYDRRKRPGPGSGMRVSSSGVKKGKGKKALKLWGNSVRELTKAILKFGEAYETAESAKLQHIMEMEKQRMKFAKELELQRMKFLMKTQLELSQFNGGNGNGNGNGSGNGNSDSRGGASSGRRGRESNHMHQLNHQNENHLTNNNHANSDSSN